MMDDARLLPNLDTEIATAGQLVFEDLLDLRPLQTLLYYPPAFSVTRGGRLEQSRNAASLC